MIQKTIEGIDVLAISPAILDISPNHPEIIAARERGILMTWQEFSARYIQNEKVCYFHCRNSW